MAPKGLKGSRGKASEGSKGKQVEDMCLMDERKNSQLLLEEMIEEMEPVQHTKFGGDETGRAYCCACKSLKVNHVPWSLNPQNTPICSLTAVVHNIWLNLSTKPSVTPAFSSMMSIDHSMGSFALQVSKQIQTTDPCGEWSAVDVCLINFMSTLHETKMPVKWDIDHISKGCMLPYITKAYHFITGKYDGMNYLHQLATFCVIVCAGLLSSILLPDMTNQPSNPTQFESDVQDLDWVVCERKKGTTLSSPFIMMVIGFIILLYEQDSPIITAVHSCSNLKHCWSKHMINTFLLVCLGLATVITGSGFCSTKWLQDVAPLPMAVIQQKHAEVVRPLKTGSKYGSVKIE
ncbi:hypothetical protein EDD16DRAFT_1517130 [Pisolithus croceorrhizus]|nr:hypothetical protein EV401DRAFT_1893992 [Pisolithus croceorrhizus]KAI6125680.1 hypothetical protein EDD16DRAFT_1517130 [Pisolithus croceorrhizus]KAI6148264.1 hypothetical protein EDD17DRAFT_1514204 [Pisolithus thermaeus]